MARPRIPIDWIAFDNLCAIQCSVLEIAAYFKVSEDTIKRAVKREKKMTFLEYAGDKRRLGHISLRRRQFQIAETGDKTMLIWLGKQYLGQSDKQETEVSNKDGIPFTFTLALGDRALLAPQRDDEDDE